MESDDDKKGDTPRDLTGTAYYARSINLTMNAAEVLGFKEDVLELKALRDSVRKAFENKFLDSNGKLTTFYTIFNQVKP